MHLNGGAASGECVVGVGWDVQTGRMSSVSRGANLHSFEHPKWKLPCLRKEVSWGYGHATTNDVVIMSSRTTNDKVSPVKQYVQGVRNPGLGETCERSQPSQNLNTQPPSAVLLAEAHPDNKRSTNKCRSRSTASKNRLSEEIRGWMGRMKVIKHEEER